MYTEAYIRSEFSLGFPHCSSSGFFLNIQRNIGARLDTVAEIVARNTLYFYGARLLRVYRERIFNKVEDNERSAIINFPSVSNSTRTKVSRSFENNT